MIIISRIWRLRQNLYIAKSGEDTLLPSSSIPYSPIIVPDAIKKEGEFGPREEGECHEILYSQGNAEPFSQRFESQTRVGAEFSNVGLIFSYLVVTC